LGLVAEHRIELVECPRDAIQGIKHFIPTKTKIEYINKLLTCGFDVLDCGSFVHPSAVPQMADTADVIRGLDHKESSTELLVIVANERGAIRAAAFDRIKYLGYPFSLSEQFQKRNTNSSREDAFRRLEKIQDIARVSGKKVVAYISMAFGNPYGEEYKPEWVIEWAKRIHGLGIDIISLADTTSQANSTIIQQLFHEMNVELPDVTTGAHFHASPFDYKDKIEAALRAGCRRFDSALLGYGGCPFAKDDMVGNVPTEGLLDVLKSNGFKTSARINKEIIELASQTYNG